MVVLHIKNRSPQVLNVTVLNLQPGWGIAQVHPYNQDYDTLDPDAEAKVRLVAGLLEVFATVGPASYKWLELPPLDTQLRPRGVPTNPLEALMAALTAEQPGKRALIPIVDPSHEWTMAQVEVRVKRVD